MQSSRNLIRSIVELPAGMKFGEHDFRSRLSLLRHHFSRNTAAIVDNGNGVVDVNNDVDFCTKAGKSFIDGVINYLVDKMV